MGDFFFYLFEGYLIVIRWNKMIDEKKQKKLLEIIDVILRIESFEVFQKVLVYIVERFIFGRLFMNYWVGKEVKFYLLEKMIGVLLKEF